MSATIDGIYYSKIGTNEACLGKTDMWYVALSTSTTGVVNIPSRVLISAISCIVTTIGWGAFEACKKITNIIIPNTVTTLKQECLDDLCLTEPIIIPSSVTRVESYFLDNWGSKSIVFCGNKEPDAVATADGRWISGRFTGSILVPMNYEKDTFCLKPVMKTVLNNCPNTKEKIFTRFLHSSFI